MSDSWAVVLDGDLRLYLYRMEFSTFLEARTWELKIDVFAGFCKSIGAIEVVRSKLSSEAL
jgi:hypothetical protein